MYKNKFLIKTELKKTLQHLYPKRIDILILIIASAVLLFIGLRLPVLTVRKLWESNTFSIISGVINLWEGKNYILAFIIFFFSVIFPIVKLVTLLLIWSVKLMDHQRKWLLRGLGFLGKWSMLDVFVIAIIIVSVKLGALASAKTEIGIYYFGASILLAMLVTNLESNLVNRPDKSQ
ncbi:MAG: paraquat-inducible protein A [Candidatus Omnitrophica bacterium]|nr:paraquat-inducible protein A [Candidatus Omnitrophota bacterium]